MRKKNEGIIIELNGLRLLHPFRSSSGWANNQWEFPTGRPSWLECFKPRLVSVTNTHVDVAKVPATSASMPTGISVPATLGLVLPGLAMLALQKKGVAELAGFKVNTFVY